MRERRLWSRVRGLVTAIHAFPVLIVMATSLVLATLAHHGLPPVMALVRLLGVILGSQVAVGGLNDFVDREQDAQTQPWKPLPSGRIEPSAVLALAVAGLLVCIGLAASFGPVSLAVALVGVGGGVAYDLWLKPTPASVLGYAIGFLALVTWIWMVVGHPRLRDLLVLPAGALLLLAAHLANALPDLSSDRSLGQRGLAVVLGAQRSRAVLLGACIAAAFLCLLLSLILRTYESVVPLTLGAGLTLLAARTPANGAELSRADAARLFHLVAPAAGLIATACVLVVDPLV